MPLTCGHYLETWNRAKWKSRSALAALMRDLSAWKTFAPVQEVGRIEMERALRGEPPPTAHDLLGVGVNHAFDSPTGRFRLLERAWTHDNPSEGASIAGVPGSLLRLRDDHPDAWEWLNLAGPDLDFPLPGIDDSQFEVRPEHRRGDEFVAHERDLMVRVAADGMSGQLRDRLELLDLQGLLEDVEDACPTVRTNGDKLRDEGAARALHRQLPSRAVLVDLRWFRLQDPNLPLEQHDRTDLLGLAVALVYCDIVLTERRWAHFAQRARVHERFGTVVLSRLDNLLPVLSPNEL